MFSLLLGAHWRVTRLPVAAWVIDSEVAGVIDCSLQAVREGEVGDVRSHRRAPLINISSK